MARGLSLEGQKDLYRFEDVRREVAVQNALNNPDVVVEMDKLRITPELNIEIPKGGTFKLTGWAQKQLGSILGVQWDKWFDPKLVDHNMIQQEIQRRFSKTGDQRKLRTRQFKSDSPGVEGCNGYLRAVLGPTYFPIDDERVFARLEKKFLGNLENLRFMKNHLSRKSNWGNDHANHYTLIGDAIDLGGIQMEHPDKRVRQAYEMAAMSGELPDRDYMYPGFHMRNSEVGYSAITVDEFNMRLVCYNGMMVTTGDSRLMYRQHRPIEDAALDNQLNDVFEKVPVRWETTRLKLTAMHGAVIEDVPKHITDTLTKLKAPKHFIEAAIKAHEEEPLPTEFGVLQAITRAARDIEDMDKRFEFEALAGRVFTRSRTS